MNTRPAMMTTLFFSTAWCACATAQRLPVDTPKTALRNFLEVDCELEKPRKAIELLLRFKDQVQPQLIRILREGPDRKRMDEQRKRLDQQWKRREAFLKTNPKLGLDDEALKILRRTTKSQYVQRGLESLTRKYRERAAIGLAAIGSREALNALREVRKKAEEDFQRIIDLALKRFDRG